MYTQVHTHGQVCLYVPCTQRTCANSPMHLLTCWHSSLCVQSQADARDMLTCLVICTLDSTHAPHAITPSRHGGPLTCSLLPPQPLCLPPQRPPSGNALGFLCSSCLFPPFIPSHFPGLSWSCHQDSCTPSVLAPCLSCPGFPVRA